MSSSPTTPSSPADKGYFSTKVSLAEPAASRTATGAETGTGTGTETAEHASAAAAAADADESMPPSTPSHSSSSSMLRGLSQSSQSTLKAYNLQANNKNPLDIPEILEQVLLHVLAQSLSSSASSVSSSLTINVDIPHQVRAQRPISNRLAFLRVCRVWHRVGEPLLWRDVRWLDYQSPEVHQMIWNHWTSVRSLTFEYGKQTTDTEVSVIATAAPATALASAIVPLANSPGSSTTPTTSSSTNRPNGPRARMRSLLGGDNASSASNQSTPASRAGFGGGRAGSRGGATASNATRGGGRSPRGDDHPPGRPRLTLEQALDDLARAMSRPTYQPHYRPLPLPLRGVQFHKQPPVASKESSVPPTGLPSLTPYLHRSQLTSLTLTGLFRLETLLETILPFVPELTYLDICLRCSDRRDEIRLDKVLRTCPKLQYLSVDRNMMGKVEFDDPTDEDPTDDDDDNDYGYNDTLYDYYDHDSEHECDDDATESMRNKFYIGTPWHAKYAHPWSVGAMNGLGTNAAGDPESSLDQQQQQQHRQQQQRQRERRKQSARGQKYPPKQRPLALRVLKLKKVRMMEPEFVRLIRLCPLLEEMDVFSTIYWGWSKSFLERVAQSCPRIRHLHLTTNYVVGGQDNPPNHAGIVIHEPPQEQPQPAATHTELGPIAGGTAAPTVAAGAMTSPAAGIIAMSQEPGTPGSFDPVAGLITLFPDLLSYDARYVRFQDRTLVTLQQTCRQLERLDLTYCREVSSKAVDWFLRNTPTLKHFFASQTLLRIEDLIESAEEHDRVVAAVAEAARKRKMCQEQLNGECRDPDLDDLDPDMEIEEPLMSSYPRWWACEGLETFVIGIKSPMLQGSDRGYDHQVERADLQFYYRDYQVGSSSAASSSTLVGGASSKQYDHTQYCTFTLFQQLGRLRRLKRLELHGGRFDLGVQQHPPVSIYSLSSAESPTGRRNPSMDGLPHQQQCQHQNRDRESHLVDPDVDYKPGSKARRKLFKMKSLLSLGKGKGKATETSCGPESKWKGKVKAKAKGKHVEGSSDIGQTGGVDIDDDNVTDWIHIEQDDVTIDANGYDDDGYNSVENDKTVPSHLTGLQPLAGLRQLESFSMTWSNFPMLREQDIAWICHNWTGLEWISLGLVPESEWNQIRSWVRSRRSDIIVVFEH